MRALVAIDPNAACGGLTLRLSGAGIPFDSAEIDDVPAFLQAYDYDVLLLPMHDPSARLATLRHAGITVAAVGAGAAHAALLNLGADDAVAPGCDADELVARLRAVVRRERGHASSELWAGAAELHLRRMEVVHGLTVALTTKECAILEPLFMRCGAVHPKASTVNHINGAPDGPALRTLDVIVCKLRKKLAAWRARLGGDGVG